jgi:hypothetical protein
MPENHRRSPGKSRETLATHRFNIGGIDDQGIAVRREAAFLKGADPKEGIPERRHPTSKSAMERAGNLCNGFPLGRNHRILVRSSSDVARLALLGWQEPQKPRPASFHESPLLWDEY